MNLSRDEAAEHILNRTINNFLEESFGYSIYRDDRKETYQKISYLNELYNNLIVIYNQDINAVNQNIQFMRDAIVSQTIMLFESIPQPDRQVFIKFFTLFNFLVDHLVKLTHVPIPFKQYRPSIIKRYLKLPHDLSNIIVKYDHYVDIQPFKEYRSSVIRKNLNLPRDLFRGVFKYDYYFSGFSDSPISVSDEDKDSLKVVSLSSTDFMVTSTNNQPVIWNANTRHVNKVLDFVPSVNSSMIHHTLLMNNLIIATNNEQIKIWESGKLKFSLLGHQGQVTGIIKLPNDLIASSSVDGTVRVWNPEEGTFIYELSGDRSQLNDLLLLKNKYIITGSFEGSIQMWDLETQKVIFSTLLPDVRDSVIIKKLNENRIAALFMDGTLMVINPFTKIIESEIKIITEEDQNPEETAESMIISNGKIIVPLGGGTIKVYNPETQRIEWILRGHQSFIQSMIILPSGELMSGSYDHTLRIWNLDTGELVKTVDESPFEISDMVILPISNKIIIGTFGNFIRIWE